MTIKMNPFMTHEERHYVEVDERTYKLLKRLSSETALTKSALIKAGLEYYHLSLNIKLQQQP